MAPVEAKRGEARRGDEAAARAIRRRLARSWPGMSEAVRESYVTAELERRAVAEAAQSRAAEAERLAAERSPAGVRARVLGFVWAEPGATGNDIRDGVTGTSTRIDQARRELVAAGLIERVADGHYYVTAKAKAEAGG